MATEIPVNDEELESLMAELEAQNEQLQASLKKSEPEPEPEPTPASVVVAPEPEPTPEPDEVVEEVAEPEVATYEDLAALEAELESAVAAAAQAPEPEPTKAKVKEAFLHMAKNLASGIADQQSDTEQPAPENELKRPAEAVSANGLKYYVDVWQFREDTRVAEHILDKCMIEQSGLRAYYGAQAANAEAQAARMKARFEVIEATLYDEHRKILAATGEKTTEKMVENAVKTDPRWLKAKNKVIEAETIASINKSLVESLKDRRDMIIQLGADRRDEFKGAARVLAEQNERESLRDRAIAAASNRRSA